MQIDFKNFNIKNLPQNIFENNLTYFLENWLSTSEMVKVQTSGSTGIPKIFEIEKQRMLNSAKMTCDFLALKQGNTALLCLPIEYISGKMMVVRSLERKLKLILEKPSTKPLKNLNKEIDFCAMTPLQVENSLDKIHFIKNLIIGGAAVSENLKRKITEVLNSNTQTRIYETYGMSETLSHIALKEIYPKSQEYFNVLSGIEISVDERRCLKIFAPKLNPGILLTNDLVELLNHHQFRFLGRIDNVINSGGVKIFPEELENLVKKEIPNEVVFLGIPDEVLGQKLVLVIEGLQSENLKYQISNIKYQKSFYQPKEIIFIKKIPRTPNGKVNRKELLDLFSENA